MGFTLGGINETKVTQSEGDPNAKICFISTVPSWEGKPLSDVGKSLLLDTARRAGLSSADLQFRCLLKEIPLGRKLASISGEQQHQTMASSRIELNQNKASIFVPLDNFALETLTEHKSHDSWQLSIIPATLVDGRKTIPIIHPERVFAKYPEIPFMIFGMQRLKEEIDFPQIKAKARVFHIAPDFTQVLSFLGRCMFEKELSIDIETAHGQITCLGIALSETEAMCIPTLPQNWSSDQFHTIWTWINDVCNSPAKKVFQNFIYDCTYLSKYGISVRNLWHDTMLAQKFLHPELPMGLDTIARIYTREPYWKDEGKDWKQVQDLKKFWVYNCKDTTVTLEAAHAQRIDLEKRGLTKVFHQLVMDMAGPAAEMCWRGLPISLERRADLTLATKHDLETTAEALSVAIGPLLSGKFNARSPKQVKELFKAKGYRLPVKKGKETSDQTALLKLQQRYPNDPTLPLLLSLSEKNKLFSSYLKPTPYPDGRFRFSLNLHGTEPGRWSCKKDPWDNGINAQTISSNLKKMFVAPEGFVWLECDLKQADSRFVAWDAPEPTLIKFYNEGIDIHRFVASRPELFNKPLTEVTHDERQLGKKVGHASNYGMRGARLSEICLLEMGISLSPQRADQMLEGYHRVFPGIRMWQNRIASEIRRTKKLSTPLGRERYFYDRLGDDLYRTAYAYRPPSTVSDVINCLIKFVDKNRDPEKFHHALQAHDAAIFLCHEDYLETALTLIKDEKSWNPVLNLMGGPLQIPIEVKMGQIWGEAKKIYG